MPKRRSQQWYAGPDPRNNYLHRAWMRRGVPDHAFDGRPQIAIANTASDLTPCNAHFDEVATSVKQGVYEAGGIPLNLPVMSPGETQMRPTAMLWRNLAAMSIEEMLRGNPVDGVVLLGGCDKTIPALLMAAASVDLPALVLPGGPMLTGHFRGAALGCGTDVWRFGEEVRAGLMTAGGLPQIRIGDDPQQGALQHDGHRLDDGRHGRGAGDHDPRSRRHPRPGQPASRARPRRRPVGGGDGPGGSAAQRRHHARVVPQRDRRVGGHRRIHQRGRAPAGDRRPVGDRAAAGRLRPDRFRGAVAGERATGRHVPDGRHVPGRWASRRPRGGAGPARPDRGDRHRPAADRTTSPTPGSGTRT